MVAHHEHRCVGDRGVGVEPVELLGGEHAGGVLGDDGVHQRDGHPGQLHPSVAGVRVLAVVGVVVAAHHVQPVAERTPVAGLERRPLLGPAVLGEVALHEHRERVDVGDLGDRAPVHRLGVGLLAGLGALDRPERVVVDPAGLHLAEVDVVHGREAAQQFAVGADEGAHRHAADLVHGARLEVFEPVHDEAVVGHDQVVGDGGDVHAAAR